MRRDGQHLALEGVVIQLRAQLHAVLADLHLGCCAGTTEEHSTAIAEQLRGIHAPPMRREEDRLQQSYLGNLAVPQHSVRNLMSEITQTK